MLRLEMIHLALLGALVLPACDSSSSAPMADGSTPADTAVEPDAGPATPDSSTAPDPGAPWALQLGGDGTDEAAAVAVDGDGNVYLTGWFSQAVDFGEGPATSAGEEDIFVVSFDPAGKLRWARQFGGSATDQGLGLAVAGDEVVVVGGFESAEFTVGSDLLTNKGGEDIFIISLGVGGQPRWARGFGGGDHERATAVALDAEGNHALTGFFTGEIEMGGQVLKTSSDFDVDVFVASFHGDRTLRWAKRFGNGMYDRGRAITFDHGGGVIVAGEFIFEINFGNGSLEGNDKTDAFVASFDPEGEAQWAVPFGGAEYDSAYGVAVDEAGNVAVVGQFGKEVTFGSNTVTASGKYDAFLVGLDPAGKVRWLRTISSPGPDRGYGVAMDAVGSVYLTGAFQETATFQGGELISEGASDLYLISYDSAGALRWAERLGGADYENGAGVAAGPSGEVFACGYFSGELDAPGGTTLTAAAGRDALLWRHAPAPR